MIALTVEPLHNDHPPLHGERKKDAVVESFKQKTLYGLSAVVERWSLRRGGRWWRFDSVFKSSVLQEHHKLNRFMKKIFRILY